MAAVRQDRSAIEHGVRIGRWAAIGIEPDTLRQQFAMLRGEQDFALRHDARRLVPNQRSRPGRGQANAIGLVPSNLRLPPHTTIRCRPFTMANAINPSTANGSISGQTAAKWCELRIATAAIPCRRAFSRSSGALARNAGCAKPL